MSLLAAPATAACWETEEYEAARLREVQTVLMVSALRCGRSMPEMPAAYNRWVGRAKADLLEGEKKLVAHFVREGDKLKYDKFTTALANKYSELADPPSFCQRAKALLDADEQQNGILASVVILLNAKPNGVDEVCPRARPQSVIVVSPFDPLPTPASLPATPASLSATAATPQAPVAAQAAVASLPSAAALPMVRATADAAPMPAPPAASPTP